MRRLIVTLTMAGLAAGLVATPASAATVRVVDGDGKGSAASCDSSTKAYKTIQAGVNAAKAGDTVLVCPGTYDEQVTIGAAKDRLKLRGVGHWLATVQPTTVESKTSIIAVADGADRVSISELRIRYAAALPPVAGGTCVRPIAAISVLGREARIRTNNIAATGEGRLFCGLISGIAVGQPSGASGSASIKYNVIKDFSSTGILAAGSDSAVNLFRNSILFYQRGASVPTFNRTPSKVRPAGQRPIYVGGAGIAVVEGAEAVVRENTVEASRPGRGPISRDPEAIYLSTGILVDGSTTSEVRANRIYRASSAMVITPVTSPAQVVSGPVLQNNLALASETGILVSGSGAQVLANQVHSNIVGIYATVDSGNNEITGNDARYNLDIDCVDETSVDVNTVANTWTANLGDSDQPAGICTTPIP